MRTLSVRAALQGLAVLALAAIPTRSQEGTCQGDVYWYRTLHEESGVMYSRLSQARCISFGCASACTKTWVAGEFWNWSVCRCGDEVAPACCTIMWHSTDTLGVNFSTTGTCPACNESGNCEVKTILLYSSTDEYGVTRFNKETVAICSG